MRELGDSSEEWVGCAEKKSSSFMGLDHACGKKFQALRLKK